MKVNKGIASVNRRNVIAETGLSKFRIATICRCIRLGVSEEDMMRRFKLDEDTVQYLLEIYSHLLPTKTYVELGSKKNLISTKSSL